MKLAQKYVFLLILEGKTIRKQTVFQHRETTLKIHLVCFLMLKKKRDCFAKDGVNNSRLLSYQLKSAFLNKFIIQCQPFHCQQILLARMFRFVGK